MAAASTFAFNPLGPTSLLVANNPAPTPVQVNVNDEQQGFGQYRIINNSTTVTAFLGVGSSAAQATARAATIVAGTPAQTIVLVPGAVEVLRLPNNAYFTAYAAAAANIYIMPGQGL